MGEAERHLRPPFCLHQSAIHLSTATSYLVKTRQEHEPLPMLVFALAQTLRYATRTGTSNASASTVLYMLPPQVPIFTPLPGPSRRIQAWGRARGSFPKSTAPLHH